MMLDYDNVWDMMINGLDSKGRGKKKLRKSGQADRLG